jgi:hypothetical protein
LSERKANVRKQKRILNEMMQEAAKAKEPPSLPSLDELIAESRARGWNDLARTMERLKFLDSPKGQKFLERRERRISRL